MLDDEAAMLAGRTALLFREAPYRCVQSFAVAICDLLFFFSVCDTIFMSESHVMSLVHVVRLSEGRGQNNQQPTPNDNNKRVVVFLCGSGI